MQKRYIRPVVDAAMALLYLVQMLPGKTGNPYHELEGVALVVLFVVHHLLNRGWTGRLKARGGIHAWVTLACDTVLLVCFAGMGITGVLMSRSALPAIAIPAVAHIVRPLHGALVYVGLMACALHAGLHIRAIRGYLGRRGRVEVPWAQPLVAGAIGVWAFVRLGVAGKLMGQPSFPDAMTPLVVQVALHLALCLPFVVIGSMIDVSTQKGKRRER